MAKIQGQKGRGRFLYSRYMLVLLVILVFLILKGVWGMYKKDQASKDLLLSSVKQLDSLSERKKILSEKMAGFETERGIEEEIRTNLSVVKDGEKVISIVEGVSTNTASATQIKKSFWAKMFDF